MEFVIVMIVIAAIVFFIGKRFVGSKMTATEDYFEQAGVKVDFKTGIIKINKYTYDINKVTGINTVTNANSGQVEISVDDFKKPIHRISIPGGYQRAPEFSQRLCVAIRKAGGSNFY